MPKSLSRIGAGGQEPILNLWRKELREASFFFCAMDREAVPYCLTFPLKLAHEKTTLSTKNLEDNRENHSAKEKSSFRFQTSVTAPLRLCPCAKYLQQVNWKWRILNINLNWNKSLQMQCLKLACDSSV